MRLLLKVLILIVFGLDTWAQKEAPGESLPTIEEALIKIPDAATQGWPLPAEASDVIEVEVPRDKMGIDENFVNPQDLEEIQKDLGCSREEALKVLVARKEALLKFGKILKLIPEKFSAIRTPMLESFQRNLRIGSKSFLQNNRDVVEVRVTVPLGFFVPKIVEQLEKKKWGSYVSPLFKGSFAYVFGFGSSLVRIQTPEGPRWRLRLHTDFERVDRIVTWFMAFGITGSVAKYKELNEGPSRLQSINNSYLGQTVTIGASGGRSHFIKVAIGDGAGLPPSLVGLSMLFGTTGKRLLLLEMPLPKSTEILAHGYRGFMASVKTTYAAIRTSVTGRALAHRWASRKARILTCEALFNP